MAGRKGETKLAAADDQLLGEHNTDGGGTKSNADTKQEKDAIENKEPKRDDEEEKSVQEAHKQHVSFQYPERKEIFPMNDLRSQERIDDSEVKEGSQEGEMQAVEADKMDPLDQGHDVKVARPLQRGLSGPAATFNPPPSRLGSAYGPLAGHELAWATITEAIKRDPFDELFYMHKLVDKHCEGTSRAGQSELCSCYLEQPIHRKTMQPEVDDLLFSMTLEMHPEC